MLKKTCPSSLVCIADKASAAFPELSNSVLIVRFVSFFLEAAREFLVYCCSLLLTFDSFGICGNVWLVVNFDYILGMSTGD